MASKKDFLNHFRYTLAMARLPLFLITLFACASEAPPPEAPGCASCHGTEGSGGPPAALGGLTDPSFRGVGAHAAHQSGPQMGLTIPCSECHIVPSTVEDEGHIDTPWPAETKWGPIANAGGARTSWNTETLTCTGSYCHGATLTGGIATSPSWVDPKPEDSSCQGCHGSPPPAPHPSSDQCGDCHIRAEGEGHIDGVLQVDENRLCDTCHGADGDPAPPPAINGAMGSADPGVGAHVAHLDGAILTTPIPCFTCHPVPATVDAPNHNNGITELVFVGDAVLGGVDASYDQTHQSCTVYCHGPTFPGGTASEPVWTERLGSGCDRCHGSPPAAPHPPSNDCAICHESYANGLINTALHIDGVVQTTVPGCDGCHGAFGNPAPPPALNGAIESTDPSVGAHTAHLSPSALTGEAVSCDTCHPVPTHLVEGAHLDGSTTVELTDDASLNGTIASYNPTTQSCTVYCHGTTLSGGVTTTPQWTQSLGASCDLCHGAPPPSPHPQGANCAGCHPSGGTSTPANHINGLTDF